MGHQTLMATLHLCSATWAAKLNLLWHTASKMRGCHFPESTTALNLTRNMRAVARVATQAFVTPHSKAFKN